MRISDWSSDVCSSDLGWRVAMATSSNERGLSLRSPGRFSATAQRLIELWRETTDPSDTAARNSVVDAWLGAEAYRLHTFGTVTRLTDGGQPGAESSIPKVNWSELDIAMHETSTAERRVGKEGVSTCKSRWTT